MMCVEQLGAAVGAHAVQRRPDLGFADVRRACGTLAQVPVKSALPFAASPGFSISGVQRRDDVGLGLARRAAAHRVARRLRRDLTVGVRPEPRDIRRAEVGRR